MSTARHAYGQLLYREPWDVPRMTAPSHSSARDQTLSGKYQLWVRLLLLQAPIIPTRGRGQARRTARRYRLQGDARTWMQQVKAPAFTAHHKQTREDGGHIMQVKTKVKAGALTANHNQTLVRATAKPR
jgi:hypothetical protein